MFKKVLKYDMASIKRYWWMIAVTVLGMSVFGSLVFRMVEYIFTHEAVLEHTPLMVFVGMAGIIFLFVCVLASFSSVLVTAILTYLRFYRNFFTDEGYLTFTLPVSRKTLYLSKTVNSVIWTLAHFLLLLAGVAIVMTIAPTPKHGELFNLSVWEELGEGLTELWGRFGAWTLVYALEFLLMAVCSVTLTVGLVQLCVTIGSIMAKKHKLLASIGIYYAVNMATSTVSQVLVWFVMMFASPGVYVLLSDATETVRYGSLALLFLLITLAIAAISMILHFVSLGLLERKLNLA